MLHNKKDKNTTGAKQKTQTKAFFFDSNFEINKSRHAVSWVWPHLHLKLQLTPISAAATAAVAKDHACGSQLLLRNTGDSSLLSFTSSSVKKIYHTEIKCSRD